ncbi:MAG TPA: TonB family protein [Opitutaceae bacterium]|nr:TonB family protein [Opitutaceae bacterium]
MSEDPELLHAYAESRSQPAFAEFVRRHIDFVYGCAVRRVGGDTHYAEDVAQQVFVAAARDAGRLAGHPVITGWLYTATRNAAAQLVRSERRRHARETEAQAMAQTDGPVPGSIDWERLRPVLDDALDRLGETDRRAVLLRYFEGKSYAEVGSRLNLGENSARMRVDRALDKLSAILARRGMTSTAAALAAALAAQPGLAAPAGLAATVTTAAFAGSAAGGSIAAAFTAFMSLTKVQVAITGVLAVAGTTGFVLQAQTNARLTEEVAALRQENAALAPLRQENLELRRTQAEAASLRHDTTEFARLGTEVAGLQRQLRTVAVQQAAAGGPAAPIVFDAGALDELPRPRSRTAPNYPFEMRRAGITGEVTVDFIVDKDGNVHHAKAIKSTRPEFEASAIEAISNWKFDPGLKGGRVVNTHMQVPIVYSLQAQEGQAGTPRPAQ